jgi:hypothetical protein
MSLLLAVQKNHVYTPGKSLMNWLNASSDTQKLGRHALGAEIDQKMIELCQAREIYVDDSPIVSV